MEDLPISFSWIYTSLKTEKCVAYCFAYIRDPKTYNVLYAGVKYDGLLSRLRDFRPNLRKTAIARLYHKPIFANFSLGNEESFKKNITNKKFKFNGFSNDLKSYKTTTALGKFFVYCALNQKFSDLGIHSTKSSADLKIQYIDNKYEVTKTTNTKTIYIKYGYENKEEELKRLTGNHFETICNLRKRAKFYGKNKERFSIEELPNLSNEYLEQFGIKNKPQFEPKKHKFNLHKYHDDKHIVYYKVDISKRTRVHIAFLKFKDWINIRSKWAKEELKHNLEYNDLTYCFAYSLEKKGIEGAIRKTLHRKIVVDRLVKFPNIIEAKFFKNYNVKEMRVWFSKRFENFYVRSPCRYNFEVNDTLYLKGDEYVLDNTNEQINIYFDEDYY